MNYIVKTLSAGWETPISAGGTLPLSDEMDYAVVANDGSLVAVTRPGLNESINDAIRNRDTVVDIDVDGEIVGKVLFYNDTVSVMERHGQTLFILSAAMLVLLLAVLAGYLRYFHVTILSPFNRMKDFARYIAAGNLSTPLKMDKNNLFGAFTESFDLMREELKRARENERRADRSKKELVASLSHDIKTPVASIKSATELMLFTTDNAEYKEQLEGINAKAEQINALITNMFHATLEELEALSVTVSEVPSTAIHDLIRHADFEKRVKPFELPSCLCLADPIRLSQVLDNIIGNSYKYAATDIEISAFIEEQYLVIEVTDFGPGVPKDELSLILTKFYRGRNAQAKGGYGLGLYISKYLMEQMLGGIRCENRQGGFSVGLSLRLAG